MTWECRTCSHSSSCCMSVEQRRLRCKPDSIGNGLLASQAVPHGLSAHNSWPPPCLHCLRQLLMVNHLLPIMLPLQRTLSMQPSAPIPMASPSGQSQTASSTGTHQKTTPMGYIGQGATAGWQQHWCRLSNMHPPLTLTLRPTGWCTVST